MRNTGKVPGQGGAGSSLMLETLAEGRHTEVTLRLFRLWTYRDLEIPEGKPINKGQRWEGLQARAEGKLFESWLLEGMAGYKFGNTPETYLLPEKQSDKSGLHLEDLICQAAKLTTSVTGSWSC